MLSVHQWSLEKTFFHKRFFQVVFRERGRGDNKKGRTIFMGQRNICQLHVIGTTFGDWIHNCHMCHDQESHWQTITLWQDSKNTEPHSSAWKPFLKPLNRLYKQSFVIYKISHMWEVLHETQKVKKKLQSEILKPRVQKFGQSLCPQILFILKDWHYKSVRFLVNQSLIKYV